MSQASLQDTRYPRYEQRPSGVSAAVMHHSGEAREQAPATRRSTSLPHASGRALRQSRVAHPDQPCARAGTRLHGGARRGVQSVALSDAGELDRNADRAARIADGNAERACAASRECDDRRCDG